MSGYDRQHPHFQVSSDGGRDVDDGYFTIVLNTNPYTYLGNRPLDLSPAATLDRRLVAITFTTMSATADPAARSPARCAAAGSSRARTSTSATDVRRLVVEHDEPFPYQVDGDYLGSTSTGSSSTHVPDAVRLVFPTFPLAPIGRLQRRRRRATPGTLVQMPSTPHAISSTQACGVVARPRVDPSPAS